MASLPPRTGSADWVVSPPEDVQLDIKLTDGTLLAGCYSDGEWWQMDGDYIHYSKVVAWRNPPNA